jgi:PAS domain S-box-containing protein
MGRTLRKHPTLVRRQAQGRAKTERASEEQYRDLFENALEGVFRSTPEGRFLEVNPALVHMLGYESAAEVLALQLSDDLYVNPAQREQVRGQTEARGKIRGAELWWKKKNGESLVVSVSGRTVRTAQGKILYYEGLVLDITERKRMEEALRNAYAGLEARVQERTAALAKANQALRAEVAERKRIEGQLRQSEERYRQLAQEREQQLIASDRLVSFGELAASLAHEFNNPLGIAMGFTQDVLSETLPSDPRYRRLGIIESETRRCGQLMKNLQELARPSEPQFLLTDLRSVLSHSLELVESAARQHQIDTVLHLPTDLPRLLIDPQQLEQVLLNLFFNAIEAMPEGGTLTASGSYQPAVASGRARKKPGSGDKVVLTVTDTGTGIAPTDMPKIFRSFFTTKKKKGMGLGLSICESIMRAHGGRITVDSTLGQGTTFSLHLPVRSRSDALHE